MLPVAAWSALDDAEFLEELRDPCIANDSDKANASSEPATLRKYPDLIKHIRLILEQHGTGASERRKNTDKAFTIGISCHKRSLMHCTINGLKTSQGLLFGACMRLRALPIIAKWNSEGGTI